ncbi:MAG: tetratricopeptide repeat protein [Verrucomicrobiia bacterium]
MKMITLILLGMLVALEPALAAAPNGHDLFQKALVQEQTAGDLGAAIALYERVASEHADDRPLAAKALLHIAICRQKLGQQEALSAYQKVVERYPEQQEVVSAAKARISELSPSSDKRANAPVFQKVHIPTKIPWDAQLSPDGKRILFASGKQLWMASRSSQLGPTYPGTPQLIDTAGVGAEWCGLTWSGDGRWIGFNSASADTNGYGAIYVVSADGGRPRKVHENNRDARIVNYRMSLSPHGETLAFTSVDAKELRIYTLRLDGGAPRRLVNTPAREPVFSPDGKTIAYVEDEDLGRRGGGLWIVPAEDGPPRRVAEAKNASTPVWSPSGSMLAFVDYSVSSQIRVVPLVQNAGAGNDGVTIECRNEGLDNVVRLTGWTPDNQIGAVCGRKTEFSLYTLPVPGGKPAFVTHGGYPMQPRWSPDGMRIIHVNSLNETSGDWEQLAPAFVSAEGGAVTTVPLRADTKIRIGEYGTGNRLSPDGAAIVFAGQKHQEGRHTSHLWTLPAGGGTAKPLTDGPASFTDWFPCWSPDGQNIAFVRAEWSSNWDSIWKVGNIFVIPSGGGEPRQITSETDRVFAVGPVIWSPDGALMAFFSQDKDTADGTIKVIPATGGTVRVVTKVEAIYANKEMAWSPDSRRIAYNSPKDKIKIVSLADGKVEDIDPSLPGVTIYHLDWSPDGKRLVFGGASGGDSEFWMVGDFLSVSASPK